MSVTVPAPEVSAERGARVLPIPPPMYYGGAFAAGCCYAVRAAR